MGVWRVTVSGAHGFDLGDDLPQLLDLRFADEIILFARSAAEAAAFVDFLVEEFASVGLLSNADNAGGLTTRATSY